MFLGADVEGLEKVAKTCRDAAEFAQTVRNVLRAIVAAASIFGPWGKAFVAYLERVVIPWLERVIAALQAFSKVLSGNAEAQRKVSAGESFNFATLPAYQTPGLPSGDTHQYPVLPPGSGGPVTLPAPAPGDRGAAAPEPGAPPVLDPAPVTLPDEAVVAGSAGGEAKATPGLTDRALSGGGGGPSGGTGGGLGGGYGGSSGMDGGGSGGGPGELADPLGLLDPAAAGTPGDAAPPEIGTGTGVDPDGSGVSPVMVGGAGMAAGAGAGLLGASLLRRGSGRSSLDAGDVPLEPLRAGSVDDQSGVLRGFSTGPQVLGAGGDGATAGRSGAPPWAGIGYGGEVPWDTTGLSQHGRTSLAFGLDAGGPAVAGDAPGDQLVLPQQCAQANSCLGVVWPAR